MADLNPLPLSRAEHDRHLVRASREAIERSRELLERTRPLVEQPEGMAKLENDARRSEGVEVSGSVEPEERR